MKRPRALLIPIRFFLFFLTVFYSISLLAAQDPAGSSGELWLDIGSVSDYEQATVKIFPKESILVLSDGREVYALSIRCTHKGCMLSFKEKEGAFLCACHGAKFDKAGGVLRGPAKEPLSWRLMKRDDQGRLYVHKKEIVSAGTKLSLVS